MRISLSGVTGDSIVDGPGLRLTIFTQGCLHVGGIHIQNSHLEGVALSGTGITDA